MTVFFTADTHLGHKNIITSTNRPFKSVAEMDSAIVKRWNERVTPQDLVYHLGDFAFDDQDPYLELLHGLTPAILRTARPGRFAPYRICLLAARPFLRRTSLARARGRRRWSPRHH